METGRIAAQFSRGRALRIIPVLDLKGGEVVRAEKGRRDRYRPIVTPLSASSDAGRRRRGAADALSVPDLLYRRSRRHRGPRAEHRCACALESHARRAGTLGGRRHCRCADADCSARRTVALSRAGLRIAARRCAAAALSRSSRPHPLARFFRRRVSRPASIPRSARSLAGKGDRHDAGQGRRRRRSGFRAARGDQGEGRKPLGHRRRRRAQRGRYPRAVVARHRGGARGDFAARRHADRRGNSRRSAPEPAHCPILRRRSALRNARSEAQSFFSRRNRPSGSAEGFACAGLSLV